MKNLMKKVGETGQDNLIARALPPADTTGVVIRGIEAGATYPRGTVMARSDIDGKLVILGTTAAAAKAKSGDTPAVPAENLTAAFILCDTVEVGEEDVGTAAYRTGSFNTAALTVAEDYEITAKDRDDLRKYGIVLVDNVQ